MRQGRHFLRQVPITTFLWLFLIVSLIALPKMVFAEQNMTEEDILGDIPMVMSATRLPQSVSDTPVAMTVIGRKMIDASGVVEIPDLFRLVPGFQVGLSWRDHHTAVTYHGQSDGLSRRMQVLIDGRVAVGSLFGIIDWDRLGIVVDDIERIEVVRGPASVSYGFNAFVGAINIVTRASYSQPGQRISAVHGGEHTSIISTQHSHVGESFDYIASASYFHTDGFDDVNDESTARSGRFKGRYQFASNLVLDFQLGYSSGPWGRGGTGLSVDPVGHKDATEKYGNFRLTESTSPGNEWYLQFGLSSSQEQDCFDAGLVSELLGVSPVNVSDTFPGQQDQQDQQVAGNTFDSTANRLDIEFQKMSLLGDRHRAVWGLGYRKDMVKGIATIGKHDWENMETYRVFGNLEYQVTDRVLLNVGTSYEDNNFNKGELSTRLGANVTIATGHVLRFAVAESWRQPFLAEQLHNVALRLNDGTLFEQIQIAPEELDPERMRSYEIGYVGRWFGGQLSTEVKLYREEFEDEVEFVFDPFFPENATIFNPGAITDVNGGETDITGIETGVNWKMTRRSQLWLSYAFSEVDQHCQALAFRCFHENDATPRHTASVLASHNFDGGWEASVGYYYLDEMAWILWGAIESLMTV